MANDRLWRVHCHIQLLRGLGLQQRRVVEVATGWVSSNLDVREAYHI